jgi:hypothetical protein
MDVLRCRRNVLQDASRICITPTILFALDALSGPAKQSTDELNLIGYLPDLTLSEIPAAYLCIQESQA